MVCPECKKTGEKSRVFDCGFSRTLMYYPAFFDEDGKRHRHSRNITRTTYECSNGHEWVEASMRSCWCGWPDNVNND
jgi:hypothetical protein